MKETTSHPAPRANPSEAAALDFLVDYQLNALDGILSSAMNRRFDAMPRIARALPEKAKGKVNVSMHRRMDMQKRTNLP